MNVLTMDNAVGNGKQHLPEDLQNTSKAYSVRGTSIGYSRFNTPLT